MDVSLIPEELIVHIASFVHPSTTLSFALACKQFLRCSTGQFSLHREYQKTLKGAHLPIINRSIRQDDYVYAALGNPFVAWYIRELELDGYGATAGERNYLERPDVEDSNEMEEEEEEEVDDSDEDEDTDANDENARELGSRPTVSEIIQLIRPRLARNPENDGAGFWSEAEVSRHTRAFARTHFYLKDTDFKVWTRDWLEGAQEAGFYREATQSEIDKAVWLAVCPRLSHVVCNLYNDECDWPLNFTARAIRSVFESPNPIWPDGFLALKSIRLGVRLEERHNQDIYQFEVHDISPLFVLPNIEHIWINGLASLVNWPKDAFVAPPGSSPLKSLELQWVDMDHKQLIQLLQCATSLRSIVFDDCWIENMEDVIESMSITQQDSLQKFSYFSDGPRYPFPRETTRNFKRLSHITLDLSTFVYDENHHSAISSTEICNRLRACLPHTLESIDWVTRQLIKEGDGPLLDTALAELVTSGYLPSLKNMSVVLHRLQGYGGVDTGPEVIHLDLSNTIEAGTRQGVEIEVVSQRTRGM